MPRIAVAGCGPAGLAAALLLHRAGHDVTLFERFETPQPIGSGLMLQPTGMAVLERLGLAETLLNTGARIDRLFGKAAPHGRTVLDVHYASLGRADCFGIGIHRADLFASLYDAVQAEHIPVRTGQAITGSGLDGERRRLLMADGKQSDPFDLIVDALGSRSALAPPTGRSLAYGALWATLDWVADAGFDWTVLQQRYRAARHMIGVLPVGTPRDAGEKKRLAFFWSLRADQLDAWRTRGLEPWKAEVRALWPEMVPLLDQIRDPDQLVFARYAHRTLPKPCEPALVHIGDAWHSASPQLGQGANMALLDAWALSLGLAGEGSLSEQSARAVALRRNHVLLYQWLTAVFTPVYQSDSSVIPWARDWLIGPISKLWPATTIQAALVSGLVGNPLRKLDL
ncbi:MAG: FAD-dependent monooxygenase [Sphingobium sp.]|nr:FAD-dependent monooxygenase [Sphingobium sp.]